jgi:hypothetical protein
VIASSHKLPPAYVNMDFKMHGTGIMGNIVQSRFCIAPQRLGSSFHFVCITLHIRRFPSPQLKSSSHPIPSHPKNTIYHAKTIRCTKGNPPPSPFPFHGYIMKQSLCVLISSSFSLDTTSLPNQPSSARERSHRYIKVKHNR